MEMIRDALRPEQLEKMRKMLEGETSMVPTMVPLRKKRDFEEEADRAAFERRRRSRVVSAALAGLALLLGSSAVLAAGPTISQTNATVSVRNTELIQTLTAVGPSTVTSADQPGFGKNVSCTYYGVSHTGTPSNVFSIEGRVPGSNPAVYFPLISSAAIVADGVTTISAGINVTTAANVGINMIVPNPYRTKIVLGAGTTPTTTAYVMCTEGE